MNQKNSLLHRRDPNWFRLDNAGKLYPALISQRQTTIFRLSATIHEPVKIAQLQRALDRLMNRFSYYRVSLRRGLFWYFFETSGGSPRLQPDSRYPCMHMPIRRQGHFPFRVTAYRNRIGVEFSHVLTDGNGAIIFLKTLLAEYLMQRRLLTAFPQGLPCLEESIPIGEQEDAFRRYYDSRLPLPGRGDRAFHLSQRLIPPGRYLLTTGIVPVGHVKEKASELGVSLTEYLAAHQLYAFQAIALKEAERRGRRVLKPVRLSVPVNLRQMFPSTTMRNFFLSVEPSIDPRLGEYPFEEVVQKVHYYMRYVVDRKFLNQQITRNIKGEINPVLRMVPLSLKNFFLPLIYRTLAESKYTSGLSNLGRVAIPETMEPFVSRLDFIPPPSPGNKVKSAVVSFKDNLYISFGRLIEDPVVERHFFRGLRKSGIPVKVETN